ncbi:phosphoribosylamine--glycine ligase [Enemella dayhoffiae]|uniref:Phosphoribosylamine--glycine ligase n=1 Tax=Enemella dayhoffiae TaxID=2016507 RepID=A0A255H7G2_9ACTN|nr:phosphoribosylamine--glycine ligase [Enemella dayhoffiae]OYO23537.1 phosphoribosylamine--glycine ligase [Enemella dayhoffiae]
MRVMVIGSGAREHALAYALERDPMVFEVEVAPGSPRMTEYGELHAVDPLDPAAVAGLAKELDVDLVVIGPEAPLVAGVADAVRDAGIACFGPSAAAAQIEGSKAFAKEVMAAAGVPTARWRTCHNADEVAAALDGFGAPYVVKDDGLAAGKGVVVTDDRQAALDHAAGCDTVIVEEYLSGPEVSLFAICDGKTAVPMQAAQDFKRVGEGDTGPNTGGMGAYTPLPWAPADLAEQVNEYIIKPVVEELARRGTPFVGLLYAGLALTPHGVKVIEFNARFGDPETQPLLLQLETPLGQVLYAAATGRLADAPPLKFTPGYAVGVVIAADGYPGEPVLGTRVFEGQFRSGNIKLFHGGTARDEVGNLIVSGGRVFTVTGKGHTLGFARNMVYAAASGFHLDKVFWRKDIAEKAALGQIPTYEVPEGGLFQVESDASVGAAE